MEFNILKKDNKFRYMLLSRLQMDCNYYLGNGGRNNRQLWAGNEKDQIETMKELYNSFPVGDRPEWITWDIILDYESKMIDQVV